MTTVTGILFDKDGTLIDFMASWMPAIHEAVNHFSNNDPAVAALMLKASGYDATRKSIKGGSILAAANNQQIAECWSQFIDADADDVMIEKLNSIFQYHSRHNSVAVTNLAALFTELKSRNIKLGLATSDSQQGAINTLTSLGVIDQMDFICGYDSGHGVKPEAGMANAFCNKLDLTSDSIIVVGDNTHDIHMARNANAKWTIGVLTGTSDSETLHEADFILDNVEQIPALLDRLQ